MELKHLRYFVAAVEEGSLLAAAERLAVAQPALSRRIRDLEAELGCELLSRSVRGVSATRAGLTVFREALQVLDSFNDAVQAMRLAGLDQGRESRLGVVHSARKYDFIQQGLAAYAGEHPNAGVAISRGPSEDLATDLREGRLDATLLYEMRLGAARFGERLVHRERYVLAAHPSHRLAVRGPAALEQLTGEPLVWLLRQDSLGRHDPLLRQCRLQGLEPVVERLADSPEGLIDLVSISGGLCLTPASTALTTPAGQLYYRSIPDLDLELDLTFAWRQDLSSTAAQAFLAAMHAAIDRHQAEIESGRAEWARLDGVALVRTA